VKQREFPRQELVHFVLGQAKKVQEDRHGKRHAEVLDEIAMPLILELGDQVAGALAHDPVQRRHILRREDRIRRAAKAMMDGWIQFRRNDVPVLTDHRRELRVAAFYEIVGIGIDLAQILRLPNDPATLAAGETSVA
jgi:hypothetical protein